MITIAICTWNRAPLLDRTLTQLQRLEIPAGLDYEIIVVNNNCTDNTDEIIARHRSVLPVRRLFERQKGVSAARNCAVANACGELLLWTDDDVLVDAGWLKEYVRAAKEWPDASFFGGTIQPWFEVAPPKWIQDHIKTIEAVYSLKTVRSAIEPLPRNHFPFGANMAFRTETLRKYPFDVRLGVCENGRVSGEETDLFRRMQRDGFQGVWVGTAKVRHYVPVRRLCLRYVREWHHGYGRTEFLLNPYPDAPRLLGVPRWLLRRHWEARIKAMIFAPLRNRPWLINYCDAAITRGMLEQFKLEEQR